MVTIEQLFGTLQQSVVSTWRKHLRTAKYAKHMALDEFYKEMPEKVDALIEAWMGANGRKIKGYENILQSANMNTLTYLKELKKIVKQGYELVEDNEELESHLDDIMELINSTLYKVKELNEGRMDLAEYINESLVNEAKRIDLTSISDEEFIYLYWAEWSGFGNGRRGGVSGQGSRYFKLEDEAYRRYGRSAYDITSSKILLLDKFISEEFGLGELDDWRDHYAKNDPKVADFAKRIIKLNIDDLTSDEKWLQLKEFNFKR